MTDPLHSPDEAGRAARATLRRLQARANRGLWHLCLFLALSLSLLKGADLLPRLPDEPHALLGRPPPTAMISFALVAYSFSAIILTLGRIANETDSGDGLHHVGYLTAFYAFYHVADGLKDNFWAVFAAGTTILGLVAYNNWTRQQAQIQEELARLARFERREEPPPVP